MAFRISRKSLRSSASRLRTIVIRTSGMAAVERIIRIEHAMINSRRVMPASLEQYRRSGLGRYLAIRFIAFANPPLRFLSTEWLRGLDSNQDNQLQRLMSYQLDDPGVVANKRFTL